MAKRVYGTAGNDYIDVTAKLIGSGETAGEVYAGDGIDRVIGGAGNDTLYGESGNDQLVGNAGNDLLIGGAGNDQMSGGADNDTLDGGIDNDTMGGDVGDDSLVGGLGMDALTGGDGNDTLDGGDDIDSLSGNAGNDLLLAGAGDDRANGGAGNDTVYGGLGADTIDGNLDNDLVYGEQGNDTLLGGDGNDTVDGGGDNDIVMGAAGDDLLYGGDGDDLLEGGTGRDTVDAGAGNDTVKQTFIAMPTSGIDMLDGGAGIDTLHVALTLAQWQTAGIQADLAGLSASFASPLGQIQAYNASSLGLSAVRFEKLMVSVDGNYAPTEIALSASTIGENVVAGAIGTLTTTDASLADTFTYTVDDVRFEVVAGMLALKAGESLNYEDASSVAVNITATDSTGLSITRAFTINVADVNEAPVIAAAATASFAENATGPVYTATAADPDAGATLSYSLTGTDAALFNIDASTGAVTFKTAPNFEAPADAGADNVYDVNVVVSDGNLTASQALAITVTDINEAPTVASVATASFAENGTGPAYTVTGADPDAGTTLSYAISGGVDAALFNINATSGAVTFKTAPNFEAPADNGGNNVYDIVVTASDGALTSASKAVAITVTNVNEAPILTSLIPDVYTTAGAVQNFSIASRFSDPDAGTTLSYSITGGTLPTGINFNTSTGAFTGSTLAVGALSITVQASDGSLTVSDTFRFSVSTAGGPSQQDDFLDYRGDSTGRTILALNGADTVHGTNFADSIIGGSGNNIDLIFGGAGNDTIETGSNADTDIIAYDEANSGIDIITDFTKGSDKIAFYASTTGVRNYNDLTFSTQVFNGTTVVKIHWGTDASTNSIWLGGAAATPAINGSSVVNNATAPLATDFIFNA